MANETVLLQELWRLQKVPPTVALLPTGDVTTPDAVGVDFPIVLRYEGEWLLFYTAFDGQQRSVAVAASPICNDGNDEASYCKEAWMGNLMRVG